MGCMVVAFKDTKLIVLIYFKFIIFPGKTEVKENSD